MPVSFEDKKIGEGITFSKIIDDKFKSNAIIVRFIMPLDKEKMPQNSLLVDLLGTSNAKVPSRELLNEKLSALYGSRRSTFSYNVSDYQICGFVIDFINDSYAIDDEVISQSAASFLLDCIFSPHLENGMFCEKYFKLLKEDLIDSIESTINNKRRYAVIKATQTMFAGEPACASSVGNVENAKKITQQDLLDAYENLLKNSAVDITMCGNDISQSAQTAVLDAFTKLNRDYNGQLDFCRPSQLRSEVKFVEETMDISQCKMVMGFKTENSDIYVDKLMCAMFGGSPTSKLFTNVREKLSLCYYCAAGLIEGKSTLLVDSGIDAANIKKARAEIINQLTAMQNGDFSDDELENTKKYLIGAFRSNYDSVMELDGWYFYQFARGTAFTPDEVAAKISAITREDIMNSAKGYKLDTVYTLIAKNGGEQ